MLDMDLTEEASRVRDVTMLTMRSDKIKVKKSKKSRDAVAIC